MNVSGHAITLPPLGKCYNTGRRLDSRPGPCDSVYCHDHFDLNICRECGCRGKFSFI